MKFYYKLKNLDDLCLSWLDYHNFEEGILQMTFCKIDKFFIYRKIFNVIFFYRNMYHWYISSAIWKTNFFLETTICIFPVICSLIPYFIFQQKYRPDFCHARSFICIVKLAHPPSIFCHILYMHFAVF